MSEAAGAPGQQPRVVIPAFRWLLVPFVLLASGTVISLFIGTTRTKDFFAWTIAPPLTAALLGAAYGGALILFAFALRERFWANTRIAVFGPLVLSMLTLAATLIHLQRFHLDAGFIAAGVAWIWLIVYIIVPPAFVLLVALQIRAPGGDPPRSAPAPAWLRGVLLVYGIASLVGGMFFFVVPKEVAPHWPWAVTALTGQAIAAWIVALGVAAVQGVVEGDLVRTRAGLAAFAIIGGLGLIAVVRYSDDVRWNAGGWALVAVLIVMLGAGGYGWMLAQRVASHNRDAGPPHRRG